MKTTTTRQMWPQSRESTLSSTERKETRSRKRKRTNPVTRFPRTSIVISSTLSIKSENALKRIEMKSWTNFPRRCILYTFLDAWRYDEDLILSASQQEILDVVNLLERRWVKVSLVWLSCGVEKLWGTLEHTCWTDGYKSMSLYHL